MSKELWIEVENEFCEDFFERHHRDPTQEELDEAVEAWYRRKQGDRTDAAYERGKNEEIYTRRETSSRDEKTYQKTD